MYREIKNDLIGYAKNDFIQTQTHLRKNHTLKSCGIKSSLIFDIIRYKLPYVLRL